MGGSGELWLYSVSLSECIIASLMPECVSLVKVGEAVHIR